MAYRNSLLNSLNIVYIDKILTIIIREVPSLNLQVEVSSPASGFFFYYSLCLIFLLTQLFYLYLLSYLIFFACGLVRSVSCSCHSFRCYDNDQSFSSSCLYHARATLDKQSCVITPTFVYHD